MPNNHWRWRKWLVRRTNLESSSFFELNWCWIWCILILYADSLSNLKNSVAWYKLSGRSCVWKWKSWFYRTFKIWSGNSTATATRNWSTRRQMLWWSRKIRRGAHECNLTGKQVLVYIIINLHVPLLLICINIAAEKAAFTADPAGNGFCGLSASSIDGPSWHEARPQSSVHHEALVKRQRLHQQERKRSSDACSVLFPQNGSRSFILFYGLPAQPGRPVAWNSLMSDGKSLAHECGDKTPSITWASRPRRIEALDELEALGNRMTTGRRQWVGRWDIDRARRVSASCWNLLQPQNGILGEWFRLGRIPEPKSQIRRQADAIWPESPWKWSILPWLFKSDPNPLTNTQNRDNKSAFPQEKT